MPVSPCIPISWMTIAVLARDVALPAALVLPTKAGLHVLLRSLCHCGFCGAQYNRWSVANGCTLRCLVLHWAGCGLSVSVLSTWFSRARHAVAPQATRRAQRVEPRGGGRALLTLRPLCRDVLSGGQLRGLGGRRTPSASLLAHERSGPEEAGASFTCFPP